MAQIFIVEFVEFFEPCEQLIVADTAAEAVELWQALHDLYWVEVREAFERTYGDEPAVSVRAVPNDRKKGAICWNDMPRQFFRVEEVD